MIDVPRSFHVWVIASSDEYAEQLAVKLIRRGYTVGPMGGQLIQKRDDNPAVIVAMTVTRTPNDDASRGSITPDGVFKEVVDVIKQVQGKYWGLVVAKASDSTWDVGNVSIAAEAQASAKKLN